ncbi:histidine phosphatase family protein [Pleomorphochaeta sp. DL1XJH-081]|uniref:histidine phosphatase family protein n=1 Tax=Pleomorphochaeta sp. DL1XJH-081 TaxID=3409690 RepID=UPI003BB50682
MKIYIIRHSESEANTRNILAGQLDYPLSQRGIIDAQQLCSKIFKNFKPQVVYSSPLIRAIQTAVPLVMPNRIPLLIDERLIEHNIGIFAGKTYAEVEADSRYEKNRLERWKWTPPSGESYEQVTTRLISFFSQLQTQNSDCLIVTHAVTMRLIKGLLENTLPSYPEEIPKNGELWEIVFEGLGHTHYIKSHFFNDLIYRGSKA